MTAGTQGPSTGSRKLQLGALLAAMLVAALLAPSGLTALAGESPPEQTFTDVPPGHPFYDEIEWMAANDISNGYEPGPTYRPDNPVSRQAMSAFMYRLAGEPVYSPPGTPTFSDVGLSHPFFKEVEWMSTNDITNGFPGGTYQPDTAVSRQAMSAFMYRLAGQPAYSPPGTPSFSDVGTGNAFYSEIEWMSTNSISEGYDDDTFRPSIAVSRQAMSAFMKRLADGPGVGV